MRFDARRGYGTDNKGSDVYKRQIQNIRKESGFEVTDKIRITIGKNGQTDGAVESYGDYIAAQTLAVSISSADSITDPDTQNIELDDLTVSILVKKA